MIRVNKPEKGNKYYINVKDGGYNRAEGNPRLLNKDLTSFPNCIAIYGWFNEPGENGMIHLKTPWYPYSVIPAAKAEGLTITKEPTLGGIMVWTGGNSGLGHVAGVAEIISKDEFLSAESEYYGVDWANYKRKRGNGNWADGCGWMSKSKIPYVYRGCIRNPFISEEDTMTKEERYAEWKEFQKRNDEEVAKLLPGDWAKDSINMNIADGTMVGYEDGFHAQSKIRREEVSQIAANLKAWVKEHVELRLSGIRKE